MDEKVEEEVEEKKIRWRYFIDRKFQNHFLATFSLIGVLVILLTLGSLYLLNRQAYSKQLLPGGASMLTALDSSKEYQCTDTKGAPVSLTPPISGAYFNAFQLYWPPIVFTGVLNLVLIIIFGLFYSHRMAGPIHNIKRSLAELVDNGEPRPIRVRKGDHFQDLAELLNQLIEKRVK